MFETLVKKVKLFFNDNKASTPFAAAFIAFIFIFGALTVQPAQGSTTASANSSETVYWLKLAGIKAHSSMTIYMGFASKNSVLFNRTNVGEAPQLSPVYGQYDDGAHVFLYYTNFTELDGWIVHSASVFYGRGLNVSFNGYGYVTAPEGFGPGTAFISYVTEIGDTDNVGYFDTNESLNGGTTWAGAFIRLACGNTYPDQWNASGEANGCGNLYGYFVNVEGVPGIYYVEILSSTSSRQSLNGVMSGVIDVDYPSYPANVGFSGPGSLSAQWAAVLEAPPNGVMPTASFGTVRASSSASGVKVPQGILYYVPIKITNDQSVQTQSPYQQMILVNSSAYSEYEAPNLQNVEFFYANGTIIPSWLQSGNSNTAGTVGNLVLKVNSSAGTTLIVNGRFYHPNASGYLVLKNIQPGNYDIFAENPYYRWFYKEYNVSAGTEEINITLGPAISYKGIGLQYPWTQIGPAYISNPFNAQGSVFFNASGHIGLIQIDPKNADIIYIASGFASDGIMGPIADGGVYVTYNDGKTWMPRDFGLAYGPPSALYMDPENSSILLVAISNKGIYRTTDGGLWWYRVSNITEVNNFQESDGIIFAGSGEGVIESSDGGQSWKIIYHSQYFTGPVSVSGSTIYAMVWGPPAPGIGLSYIYFIRSTNFGENWTTLHTFVGNYPMFISASPFNPSQLYFAYAYPGNNFVMYSDDGGLTYANLSIGPLKAIVFDPDNQSVLWGYGPGRFIYSLNGGKSFRIGEPATDQMGLAVYPGNGTLLVLGSDQGLYQSNDAGLTWKPISGDLGDLLTYSVSVGGSGSIIAVGMQDYSAFLSLDAGKSWIGGNTPPIPIGGEGTDIVVNPENSSWMYALSWSAGLSVSKDSGMSFENVVQGSPSYLLSPQAVYINPYNESLVYFAYVNGIYNGTDYGSQWKLWNGSPKDATTIAMTGPHSFVAGTTDGVYYEINGSWIKSEGITNYVTSFAVDPINSSIVLAATGMFSQGSLYISYDSGRSFELLNQSMANTQGGLFGIPLMVYWLNTTDHPVLAATVNHGILISLDQGRSWVPINFNLRSGEVTSACYVNNDLYISTYGEGILVWRNFSVSTIPATINGFVGVPGATVSVNGSQVPVYEGHWQAFLKPANYVITISAQGLSKTYVLHLSPMQTVNITTGVSQQLFNITFTESGLPSGTRWSVTLGNTTKSSTGNITFTVPEGKYNYSIGLIDGFMTSPAFGSIIAGYSNVVQQIAFVPVTFNYTFNEFVQKYPEFNVTMTAASSGLQINAISYGGGVYLIGGENTQSSPLLLEYNASNGAVKDLSSLVPGSFKFVTSISYVSGTFYIAGIASGDQMAFAEFNSATEQFVPLSSYFPSASGQPYVYALASLGNLIYLGGYYQINGGYPFLYSYNTLNGQVSNLSGILPTDSVMTMTVSSNGKNELLIAGILGNYSSFAEIYNSTAGTAVNVDLPGDIESLEASAFYDGSFFIGGSSLYGGELLEVNDRGSIVGNYSSYFGNYIQLISLTDFNGGLFAGGWGPHGAFGVILNTGGKQGNIINVNMSGGWGVEGSELLSSASGGDGLIIGGAVTTQFNNYSGALLGLIHNNMTFSDLSNDVPKTYQSTTYYGPPQQYFYVGAVPNTVSSNGTITFYGQFLNRNGSYELFFANSAIPVTTNSYGAFSCTVKLNNLSPGDYLITLANGSKNYYNYFAVLYYYPSMIYGSKIPKTAEIGYSNLMDGVVVRYGRYIEFYRQTKGEIPVTSINYLVQWNQILFQNLTSHGWSVAPIGQLGYASEFSVNPMVFQYSFWNDYGIVKVTTSGQFINLPKSNTYLYMNGNTMILWIPYSLVNESEFPWVFATDYVQNSPIYNPNYRLEAGQGFVSYYYSSKSPTSFIPYTVNFSENGLPIGTEWSATLNGMTKTSTTSIITFRIPNGTYYFSIEPIRGYLASPSSGYVTVNGTNISEVITFSQIKYSITFDESGLPANTSWSVNLNGATKSSTTEMITFNEPNGVYYYTVSSIPGYTSSPSNGTITVNGSSVTQRITFSKVTPATYNITFTESGLATGTQWSVTLNGVTRSSTSSTITFTEPAGNYTYTISSPSGYEASQSSGSVSVSAASVSAQVSITFTSTTTTTPTPSTPSNTLMIAGIVIVAIIMVIAFSALKRRK